MYVSGPYYCFMCCTDRLRTWQCWFSSLAPGHGWSFRVMETHHNSRTNSVDNTHSWTISQKPFVSLLAFLDCCRSFISNGETPTPGGERIQGGTCEYITWSIFAKNTKWSEREKGLATVNRHKEGLMSLKLLFDYGNYPAYTYWGWQWAAVIAQYSDNKTAPASQVIIHVVVLPVVFPGRRNVSSGEGPAVGSYLTTTQLLEDRRLKPKLPVVRISILNC